MLHPWLFKKVHAPPFIWAQKIDCGLVSVGDWEGIGWVGLRGVQTHLADARSDHSQSDMSDRFGALMLIACSLR